MLKRSLAAFLLGALAVLVVHQPVIGLCHSFQYRAHADRIGGFRDGLANHNPDLSLSDILHGQDEQLLSERLVSEALRRSPGTVGIYNAGGANRAVQGFGD